MKFTRNHDKKTSDTLFYKIIVILPEFSTISSANLFIITREFAFCRGELSGLCKEISHLCSSRVGRTGRHPARSCLVGRLGRLGRRLGRLGRLGRQLGLALVGFRPWLGRLVVVNQPLI